ncbi:MAG: DUF4349 domain-containing protein [Deltaproteobacteria bacterium]|nr:DUF4349 domain-containing protein [Deltaproteobacteria bacterium]
MVMKRFRRLLLFFALAYIVLVLLCLAYEYATYVPSVRQFSGEVSAPSGTVTKRNYAGASYTVPGPSAGTRVDQKYERTATVQSQSKAFDSDEQAVREKIAAYSGIIQFESGRGTKGRRMLFLHVGISPTRFDAFYKEIQEIGTVRSMDITKTDKTNEFLTLKAKRASLEKNRAALMELKKRDGRIDELMALEREILRIEQELQNLGVQLGEFDEVNAFCTVRYTLVEYTESVRARSFLSYCKSAVISATWLYAAGVAVVFFLFLTALLILAVADRFNVVRGLLEDAARK